jgi:hypothetical protein
MLWRLVIGVVAASLLAFSTPAAAQDGAAIQSTIRSQLEAFKADNGDAAYSYAAPNVKRIFPTVDAFMAMVKQAYQPVYRPRSYSFGQLETKGGTLTQRVEIVGPDGDYWTALYSLERQPDGSWRITGCSLVKSEGSNA